MRVEGEGLGTKVYRNRIDTPLTTLSPHSHYAFWHTIHNATHRYTRGFDVTYSCTS